jgi:LysM repeat protein
MAAGPGGDGSWAGDGWERPGSGAAARRGPPPGRPSPSVRRIPAGPPASRGAGYQRPAADRSGPLRPAVTTLGPTPWTSRQFPPKLPTGPTLLASGLLVLVAFIIGHVTAGGGTSPAAALKPAVVATSTTTTLPPRPATHTVASGETLSSIAGVFGLQASDLATYNGITNINHVFVGEVLKIPPATTAPAGGSTVTTLKP